MKLYSDALVKDKGLGEAEIGKPIGFFECHAL
jgi:hypothetical protein